ncbi:hypothetical protein [Thalassovita mangrovi]|uniref:Uncharacterized protein n=1 Tax=Thalassovita mangrovi TaxID=2692236 RepID=A0A6L8LE24_9RHOB|nr:hypothetical protein [Thalassovita mangrovi]MYM54188.1 hypothetical protein [Thalassovita mangrovi]
MEKDVYRYSAGLVFLDEKRTEEAELSNALQGVLEARGQRIQSVNVLENDLLRIVTDTLELDLTPPLHPNEMVFGAEDDDGIVPYADMLIGLSLTLRDDTDAGDSDPADIEHSLKSYLAEMTSRVATLTEPDFVLWLRPSDLLETSEFLKAATQIKPRKVRRTAAEAKPRHARPAPILLPQPRAATGAAASNVTHAAAKRFPEIQTASRSLETEYERRTHVCDSQIDAADLRSAIYPPTDDAQDANNSFAMRMASWVLVTTVGLFFLPVAVLLTFANVVRGEDFRLAAHTLALTGMMMALNTSGALADTMSMIGL